LLVVELSRDGTPLTLTGPTIGGTTFTYTTQLNSFGRSDSGVYTCRATVSAPPSNSFVSGGSSLSEALRVTTGEINIFSEHSHIMLTMYYRCLPLSKGDSLCKQQCHSHHWDWDYLHHWTTVHY
jgi:hypothetical protein